MRYSIVFLVLCLPSVLYPQDVNINDFRLPETFFHRLMGNLSANLEGRNMENVLPYVRSQEGSGYYGNLEADYLLLKSGESEVIEWRPSFSGSASGSEFSGSDTGSVFESRSRNERIRVSTFGQGSWYLEPESWYGYAALLFTGEYYYSRSAKTVSLNPEDVYASRIVGYDAFGGFGVGFGKVRQSESIMAIVRILDRIREEGYLLREPSRDEIVRLAQLYSEERGYAVIFERSFKHFFGDLLRELQTMGILDVATFDAYAILRVTDVRFERINLRPFGWRIQAGLEHASYRRKFTDRSRDTVTRAGLDFAVLMAEFGHALSLRTHVHSVLRAKLITSENPKSRIDISVSLSLTHEVGERIDAGIRYTFERTHGLEGLSALENHDYRNIYHIVQGDFSVYIENNIRLNVRGEYGNYSSRRSIFYPEEYTVSRFGGSIGLQYRFF